MSARSPVGGGRRRSWGGSVVTGVVPSTPVLVEKVSKCYGALLTLSVFLTGVLVYLRKDDISVVYFLQLSLDAGLVYVRYSNKKLKTNDVWAEPVRPRQKKRNHSTQDGDCVSTPALRVSHDALRPIPALTFRRSGSGRLWCHRCLDSPPHKQWRGLGETATGPDTVQSSTEG